MRSAWKGRMGVPWWDGEGHKLGSDTTGHALQGRCSCAREEGSTRDW